MWCLTHHGLQACGLPKFSSYIVRYVIIGWLSFEAQFHIRMYQFWTIKFGSLPMPAWITLSLKIITHQLPSESGRAPRQHSEGCSVHSCPRVTECGSLCSFLKTNITTDKTSVISMFEVREYLKRNCQSCQIVHRLTK